MYFGGCTVTDPGLIIDLTLVLNVPMFADRHADTRGPSCFCVKMAVVIIDLLCY